jgi:hypothetical protein
VSDRQKEVLSSIDAALDGALDDWSVSGDAMRWNPDGEEPCTCTIAEPCGQHIPYRPDSFAADLARLGDATREIGRAIAEQFAPIASAVSGAIELERRLDLLEIIVPDSDERTAYWNAAEGNLDRAIELASSGVPPVVPDPRRSEVPALPARPFRLPRIRITPIREAQTQPEEAD